METTRRDLLKSAVPAAAGLSVLGMGSSLFAAAPDAPKGVADTFKAAYDGAKYALPPLPFAADALEPHFDAQTMTLHHDKHHAAYVNNLNKAVDTLATVQKSGEIDPQKLDGLQRDFSFNAGGHILHTLLWATLSPSAGGEPKGELAEAINKSFGSFAAFKTYFSAVATGIKGSGWALLSYDKVGDRLIAVSLKDQDAHLVPGAVPLAGIDVWEHAYYLKYQNERPKYVAAWWNVINWDHVGAIYATAKKQV